MGPRITLTMIVRNEGPKLGRCLDSVRGAVNEIVVVDTGSEDDSIVVAMKHDARVEQIEWPGDFSAARNASLALVQTEWVLWLDADEWLVEGGAAKLRQAVQKENASGYLLVRRDLYPGGGFGEQHMLRLWRHHPELRFEGVIHEHLPLDTLQSCFEGMKLFTTDIAFWHDGYAPELSPEKARRNLPLLEKELSRDPESLYIAVELAQTRRSMGDLDGASVEEAKLADRLIALSDHDQPPDNTAALFLMRFMADLPDEELRSGRTESLLRLARGWFFDHPGTRYLCAQVEIRRGDLRRALDDLLEVEQMAETGRYDRLTSSNPSVLQEGLSTNLALVAHQLGRRDLARKHYERLLRLDPGNALARQNLTQL